MKQSNKKSSSKAVWIVSGCVALVLAGGCIFVAKVLMSDVGPSRKTEISTVNLIPPPPPVVKEKPPSRSLLKEQIKEEVIDAGQDRPDEKNQPDEKPAGKATRGGCRRDCRRRCVRVDRQQRRRRTDRRRWGEGAVRPLAGMAGFWKTN